MVILQRSVTTLVKQGPSATQTIDQGALELSAEHDGMREGGWTEKIIGKL